ncbi:MAG: 5'-methylthioadenosine/adenosylhomocysteine nucleosidase [Bacteroidales bacterium]|jgi:adenosylhomocysteine nucleosidase|nr:5'-methylthioadenosine/adenosylhomocysteine nucleosidase [Bacteroidales bacterium]
MMFKKKIGIMGAMLEEIDGIIDLLTSKKQQTIGMRTYFSGEINGVETTVVFSGWGKVAATATASILILEFGVTEIIFTGVAGAIHPELTIGDLVLGKRLIQHDMDARPMMKQYEIPLLNKMFFEMDNLRLSVATNAIKQLLENKNLHDIIPVHVLNEFNITNPNFLLGDIASGDKFFSDNEQKNLLHRQLPSVLCVEMEGAAVAQTCFEHQIPFTVIRVISDTADDTSPVDFALFTQKVASVYSTQIIKYIYNQFSAITNCVSGKDVDNSISFIS